MLASHPELAAESLVAGWADAGWPLVVRRAACGDEAGTIPLGLPLPRALGKRRLATALRPCAIDAVAPPTPLWMARSAAPANWKPAIDALLALDPDVRTFGSLAWQRLTGLAYLGEDSDLDLLWDLPEADRLNGLLEAIAAIERQAPMRLDGEVLGRAGGVNWRELEAGGEVLVKSLAGVCLMTRREYMAGGRP
jgi:phosphoribosyl-dephospho-CoA transferase